MLRRTLILLVVLAVAGALGACSRKITRIEQVQAAQSCFACHSDTATFLVAATQQWQHSKHSSGETLNENDGSCKDCHTSEGFVARAQGTPLGDAYVVNNPTAIHCFTCHAPHTSGDFRLRWTTPATLQNAATFDLHAGNLCVACHQSRRSVTTYVSGRPALTTRWGPHHGPQGDMLVGSNGYQYKNYTYEQTNHRGATEDGCVDCHKKATMQYVVGGHTFNMTWVGETGTVIRNIDACTPCHAGLTTFDKDSVQTQVTALIDSLTTKLVAAGLVNGSGTNIGLPKSVTVGADSAGAVWNYLLAKEDRSKGIHNPSYIMGLLRSSIRYLDGNLLQTTLVVDRR